MTTERPHMGIVPFCPQCGELAMFIRRSEYVGEEVPISCGAACGWHGYGPTTIPIPQIAVAESAGVVTSGRERMVS